MTILGVDGEKKALQTLANSLKSVFKDCDIVTFTDAMSTYKYCVNHKAEISVAFIPVILRPFDGLKLYELLSALSDPIDVVFILREESSELKELVTLNGACQYIVKPLTREKVASVAAKMVSDCWLGMENCAHCRLAWCARWTQAQKHRCE